VQAAKNEYGEVTAAAQDAAAQGVQLADAGADAGQEALNQTCEIEAAPEVPHGTSRTGKSIMKRSQGFYLSSWPLTVGTHSGSTR